MQNSEKSNATPNLPEEEEEEEESKEEEEEDHLGAMDTTIEQPRQHPQQQKQQLQSSQ